MRGRRRTAALVCSCRVLSLRCHTSREQVLRPAAGSKLFPPALQPGPGYGRAFCRDAITLVRRISESVYAWLELVSNALCGSGVPRLRTDVASAGRRRPRQVQANQPGWRCSRSGDGPNRNCKSKGLFETAWLA